ncbi:hypothetical protein L873DRAFT_1035392 [Choiromyces venosus 120613-1]|uniref:Uncharacterized protein n=1 Tax=Choiromyces venosus 120613-1 TaxID=1336337 RepID=A0A3N4JJW9_9PEZI|nr:hypothetical protein L873DRAFT_1035392 [Choiromyces venosus 120613-1]
MTPTTNLAAQGTFPEPTISLTPRATKAQSPTNLTQYSTVPPPHPPKVIVPKKKKKKKLSYSTLPFTTSTRNSNKPTPNQIKSNPPITPVSF